MMKGNLKTGKGGSIYQIPNQFTWEKHPLISGIVDNYGAYFRE